MHFKDENCYSTFGSPQDFKYYIEVPEQTNGSFDDKILSLNMPLVGALSRIQKDYDSALLKYALALIASQISRQVQFWGNKLHDVASTVHKAVNKL